MAFFEQVRDVRARSVKRGPQVARCHERFDGFVRIRRGVAPIDELIARELFGNKAVIRFVVVERLYDVIPVAPHPFKDRDRGNIIVGATCVGVAGGVKPVPAPALAVVRRIQQAVDEALVGTVLDIRKERVHLFRAWRKADQIEVGATQQDLFGRFG